MLVVGCFHQNYTTRWFKEKALQSLPLSHDTIMQHITTFKVSGKIFLWQYDSTYKYDVTYVSITVFTTCLRNQNIHQVYVEFVLSFTANYSLQDGPW